MGFLDNLKLRGVFDPNQMAPGIPGMSGMPTNPLQNTLNTIMPFMRQMNQMNIQNQRIGQTIRNEDRMQQTFNPMQPTPPQNVVFNPGASPNTEYARSMSGEGQAQKTALDFAAKQLRSKDMNEAADNKREDLKLGLDREQLKLDTLKNTQIYDVKTRDLERKAEEAEKKLVLAQQVANTRGENNAATQEINRARIEAQNARHAADISQREAIRLDTERVSRARIADLEALTSTRPGSQTVTSLDEDGNERTTTVRRGEQPLRTGEVAPMSTGKISKDNPPTAPAGWKYIRNGTDTGWTPVKAK